MYIILDHIESNYYIGGLDISSNGLREYCLTEMVARDLPGYAIGGLAGGEDKDKFWRVVAHVSNITIDIYLIYRLLFIDRIYVCFLKINLDILWVLAILLI